LRKNHSGMETDPQHIEHHHIKHVLRKNHSGMETNESTTNTKPSKNSCVRTIVVWKPDKLVAVNIHIPELRKNHSGMETCHLSNIRY